jgi:hypothetical protein
LTAGRSRHRVEGRVGKDIRNQFDLIPEISITRTEEVWRGKLFRRRVDEFHRPTPNLRWRPVLVSGSNPAVDLDGVQQERL